MAKLTTNYVVDGLKKRGVPHHVAEGIVWNLQDESGLDTGINEAAPVVPGSRGGFGLSQWTADRRVNLEAAAKARGVSVDDGEFQMDFLVEELKGPEARGYAEVLKAGSRGEAAAAYVKNVLRPAPEHQNNRTTKYLGSTPDFTGFRDADGRGNPDLTPQDYQTISAPTPMTQVELAERGTPQPYSSWWDELKESWLSNSITSHAIRWVSQGTVDPFFEIGEERAASLIKNVPDNYHSMLMNSGSEQILQDNIKWMQDDIERKRRLDAGGWSATAAGFVAGVADPIPLVTGVFTGGATSAAMAGRGLAGSLAIGAAAGAAENAGLDLASQAITDNPNADPVSSAMMGAAFGALGGALSWGGRGSVREAQAAHDMMIAARTGRVRNKEMIEAHESSMGAAENTSGLKPLVSDTLAYDTEVSDAPKGYGGSKLRFDVTGQMTTSEIPLVRVLGANLAEETAGFTDHSVVPDSANARQTALNRKYVGNFLSEYDPAVRDYLQDLGLNRGLLSPFKAARAEAEFNARVFDYVMDAAPSPDTHSSVVKVGEAFRRGMGDWTEEVNNSGLASLTPDKHYVPFVADANRIADLDARVSEDVMVEFFAGAIRSHTGELADDIVKRMARGYWRNIRRAQWGMEDDMTRAMTLGDKDAFRESLMKSLDEKHSLNEAQIDEAFDAITGALQAAGKDTNAPSTAGMRALKKRTMMDYRFKATVKGRDGNPVELSVTDLFDKDSAMLFRRYSRSMSGRVALAQTKIENPSKPGYFITDGIKGEGEVARLKGAIAEAGRQQGLGPNDGGIVEAQKNLEFLYKRVAGIPVYDNASALSVNARRLKSLQFIRLMSNMGLNQVQEGYKIVALTGVKAAFAQMPAFRTMVRGIQAGKYKGDQLLAEIEGMTGLGADGMMSRRALRVEDERMGEGRKGRVGRAIDNTLDVMSDVTTTISGMRAFHEYQTRWAMGAVTQQLAQMARKANTGTGFDLGRLPEGDVKRLASLGLGHEEANLIFRNLDAHAKWENGRVVSLGQENWEPSAVSKYRLFVGRSVDRLVQANDFGGLSKWMSHPVASMFIQFRAFVFGAWAKSTLWALNHGAFTDPRMLALLAGEIVVSAATYAIRMTPLMAEEDGVDKYLEKLTNPADFAANAWSRTATASILPMMIDSAMAWSGNRPLFGNARASGSPTDAFFGNPTVDHFSGAGKFLGNAASAAFSEDEQFTRETAKQGLRNFAPWGNFLPIVAAFSALTQGLPSQN